MPRLNHIRSSDLSREDFDRYPVWAWNDSMDAFCPIDESDFLTSQYGDVFVKCGFITADGMVFDGYVVGCSNHFAFGLFVDGGEFTFNFNLPELMEEDRKELARHLGLADIRMFPLKYYSDLRCADGRRLFGVLGG